MTEQVGLYRFKLAQRRYKSGAFYLSAIMDEDHIMAFDGRFMVEDGKKLIPTKNGFRIPADKLDHLKQMLSGDLRDLAETLIVRNKAFQLHMRYVNDKYGEGIDFRKYRTTEKYHGWERSGIRMWIEDVATLRYWLNRFQFQEIARVHNLFVGQAFGSRDNNRRYQCGVQEETVNPILTTLMDS